MVGQPDAGAVRGTRLHADPGDAHDRLAGTQIARATAATIRLQLLKIGAIVWRNTRRVRLELSSHDPHRELLALAINRLRPG